MPELKQMFYQLNQLNPLHGLYLRLAVPRRNQGSVIISDLRFSDVSIKPLK